jgi:stage II sporulation protein D
MIFLSYDKKIFFVSLCLCVGFFWGPVAVVSAESFQLKIGKLFAQGKTAEIDEAIHQELEENPNELYLWLELADLDKSQGDYSGTVAAYQSYLVKKDDWKVRVSLALSLEQMGDFANAGQNLRALNQAHPHDPELLWGLARLCLYQSHWKNIRTQAKPKDALREAQKYLLALTTLKPNFAMATWQLAEVSRALGDVDQALKAYAAVVKEDGSYKYAHRYIAQLLAEKGKYRESLAKYEQAMAIEPDDFKLKKEAQKVALLAPQEAKARKDERQKQWEDWSPLEIKPIAASSVTIRVGIFTGMGHLVFRGLSDLRVMTPAQTPITLLKAGEDYDVYYKRDRSSQAPKDQWLIQDKRKRTLVTFDQRLWIVPQDPLKPFLVHAVPFNKGYFFGREEDRAYRGLLEISPRPGNGFNAINRVTLEDYAAGVLPAEMTATWPIEALKAQAIVVRTYVLSKLGRHNEDGYDVSDNVQDQVYRGVRAEEPKSNEAVRQTAGQVLEYQGKMMSVVFSAECGGHTQDYEEAWGYPSPVVGVEDYDSRYNQDMEFPLSPARMETWIKEDREAWCRIYGLHGYQNYRWVWIIPAAEIEKKTPGIGRIRRLIVTHRSTAGWADSLLVEGEAGNKLFKSDSIRRCLGGIRSNLIWIEPQFDPKGWPEEFIIYGGGWGHGVGMCQVGCYGLAEAGKDCGEILNHYFPKGSVEKLGP